MNALYWYLGVAAMITNVVLISCVLTLDSRDPGRVAHNYQAQPVQGMYGTDPGSDPYNQHHHNGYNRGGNRIHGIQDYGHDDSYNLPSLGNRYADNHGYPPLPNFPTSAACSGIHYNAGPGYTLGHGQAGRKTSQGTIGVPSPTKRPLPSSYLAQGYGAETKKRKGAKQKEPASTVTANPLEDALYTNDRGEEG